MAKKFANLKSFKDFTTSVACFVDFDVVQIFESCTCEKCKFFAAPFPSSVVGQFAFALCHSCAASKR